MDWLHSVGLIGDKIHETVKEYIIEENKASQVIPA
jgi:hypothetical protein